MMNRAGLDRLDAHAIGGNGSVGYGHVGGVLNVFRDMVHLQHRDHAAITLAEFDVLFEAMRLSVLDSRPLDAFVYDILFGVGQGSYTYQHLSLLPVLGDAAATNSTIPREYEWRIILLRGSFSLAPNIMIVHRTEHSFFEDESWDDLVYVGRSLTPADMQDMIPLLVPIFFHGL
jgi:hypothetical protein